jgi:hypothetical protein
MTSNTGSSLAVKSLSVGYKEVCQSATSGDEDLSQKKRIGDNGIIEKVLDRVAKCFKIEENALVKTFDGCKAVKNCLWQTGELIQPLCL